MCTLTWWSEESGYEVFFNRDELKERPIAEPPKLGEHNGVEHVAPRDPAAGGSWLLVNGHGVTLALLNWYSREAVMKASPEKSRGQLVLDLADVSSATRVESLLEETELVQYQPFRLAVFEMGGNGLAVSQWNWPGEGIVDRITSPEMPIFSSSFDRDAVFESRKSKWNGQADLDPETLWRFHHGTDPDGKHSAYSVRMNRPDAQTWSISRIKVGPKRIEYLYEAEVRDLKAEPEVVRSVFAREGGRLVS